MKVVFLRLDKIGDLLATLPVDQLLWLKEKHIDCKWVVSKGLGPVVKAASPPREFMELDLKDPKVSTQVLIDYLKTEKPDAVVVFYAPWWVGYACWRAGVPLRVTRRSQWHSFLFYNKGLRQSRSLAEKHEADYNRELVELTFDQPAGPTPFLMMEPLPRRQVFEKHNLSPGQYFVVHPGMAGSALNWPQSSYNELIEKLIEVGTVVVTGTAADEPYLSELRPRWQYHPKVRWLQAQLSMEELLTVLKSARGVVAPSTGVLHLAAALAGPQVVGLYSPVRSHKATRWGPRGLKAVALSANCPDAENCQGAKCPHKCMSHIQVSSVLQSLGV